MLVGTVEGTPAAETLRPASGSTVVDGTRVPVGGDLVVAIDGESVRRPTDLLSYLVSRTEPGDAVELAILRDGQRRTVTVTLTERPADPQS